MWFTAYPYADWTPDKGYNAVFAEAVRLVRTYFQLQKTNNVGIEVGTDYWRQFTGRSGTFYVHVDRFTWTGYRNIGGNVTPLLVLNVRIGRRKGQTDTQYPLEITFPAGFPSSPPQFTANDNRFKSNGGHAHHLLSGGVLCVNFDNWNPRQDTVVSALNMALDHLTWHLTEHGW